MIGLARPGERKAGATRRRTNPEKPFKLLFALELFSRNADGRTCPRVKANRAVTIDTDQTAIAPLDQFPDIAMIGLK
jgi:hypothetical protein